MLFSERSIWTMIHGIGLGGSALLALAVALFALSTIRPLPDEPLAPRAAPIAWVTSFAALMLWLTTLVGTYVVFPPYRATPPEGTADLAGYPRAMILADPSTEWLHRFAMETKEHLPFIACMLATAVAFVAWRHRERLLGDAPLRRIASAMVAACFVVVAYLSLLGVFVNKVAPVD